MTPERFQALTSRYPGLRVAVVGDFCLDRYLEIDPDPRAKPRSRPACPSTTSSRVRAQPGGAGTILNNLVALGRRHDRPGRLLRRRRRGLRAAARALEAARRSDSTTSCTAPTAARSPTASPWSSSRASRPVELNRLDSKNWTPTPAALETRLADEPPRGRYPQVDAAHRAGTGGRGPRRAWSRARCSTRSASAGRRRARAADPRRFPTGAGGLAGGQLQDERRPSWPTLLGRADGLRDRRREAPPTPWPAQRPRRCSSRSPSAVSSGPIPATTVEHVPALAGPRADRHRRRGRLRDGQPGRRPGRRRDAPRGDRAGRRRLLDRHPPARHDRHGDGRRPLEVARPGPQILIDRNRPPMPSRASNPELDAIHPARLAPDVLAAECDFKATRRSGPGGQNRNKVETAVILTHRPTGIVAEAAERRTQGENRREALFRLRVRLALEIRRPIGADVHHPYQPSDLWKSTLPRRPDRHQPRARRLPGPPRRGPRRSGRHHPRSQASRRRTGLHPLTTHQAPQARPPGTLARQHPPM